MAVSFAKKDRTSAVGVGPGPAKIVGAEFDMYKYASGKKFPAMIVTYERDGQELEPQPYTVGSQHRIKDKQTLSAIGGGSGGGIPSSCNLSLFLNALEDDCGMPEDFFTQPEDLIGIEGTLTVVALERISGKDDKKGGGGDRSVTVFESVDAAPWLDGGKKGKSKAKGKGKDEEEDDDEDEKPAKGKGKGKDADDADEMDDDRKKELAGEALIEALDDGPLKLSKVEAAVRGVLEGSKDKAIKAAAKELAELAADEDFLAEETGWTFDSKKKMVEKD